MPSECPSNSFPATINSACDREGWGKAEDWWFSNLLPKPRGQRHHCIMLSTMCESCIGSYGSVQQLLPRKLFREREADSADDRRSSSLKMYLSAPRINLTSSSAGGCWQRSHIARWAICGLGFLHRSDAGLLLICYQGTAMGWLVATRVGLSV